MLSSIGSTLVWSNNLQRLFEGFNGSSSPVKSSCSGRVVVAVFVNADLSHSISELFHVCLQSLTIFGASIFPKAVLVVCFG